MEYTCLDIATQVFFGWVVYRFPFVDALTEQVHFYGFRAFDKKNMTVTQLPDISVSGANLVPDNFTVRQELAALALEAGDSVPFIRLVNESLPTEHRPAVEHLNIPREVVDASMEDLSDTTDWQSVLVEEVLVWTNEILHFAPADD